MNTLLSEQELTARKTHYDNGYEEISQAYHSFFSYGRMLHIGGPYLPQECFKDIKEAYFMENASLILPGDRYVRQCSKSDQGDFYMWKTKKAYFDIIKSLGLYPEK